MKLWNKKIIDIRICTSQNIKYLSKILRKFELNISICALKFEESTWHCRFNPFICTFAKTKYVCNWALILFRFYAVITFFKFWLENVPSIQYAVFFVQYMKFVGLLSMKPLEMIHPDTSAQCSRSVENYDDFFWSEEIHNRTKFFIKSYLNFIPTIYRDTSHLISKVMKR